MFLYQYNIHHIHKLNTNPPIEWGDCDKHFRNLRYGIFWIFTKIHLWIICLLRNLGIFENPSHKKNWKSNTQVGITKRERERKNGQIIVSKIQKCLSQTLQLRQILGTNTFLFVDK